MIGTVSIKLRQTSITWSMKWLAQELMTWHVMIHTWAIRINIQQNHNHGIKNIPDYCCFINFISHPHGCPDLSRESGLASSWSAAPCQCGRLVPPLQLAPACSPAGADTWLHRAACSRRPGPSWSLAGRKVMTWMHSTDKQVIEPLHIISRFEK